MTASPGPRPRRKTYRVRRAYFVRALGRAAFVAAAAMVVATLCLTLSAPGFLTTLSVAVSSVALLVMALLGVSVALPPTLVQLDADTFRASRRHTSGRRFGYWADVSSVASQQGPQGWVLMMLHRDGAHTAVPLDVVDSPAVEVEQEVRDRLNDAHGYRPLN